VALMWRFVYNGDYGPIKQVLGAVGINGPHWTSDPATALYSVAVVAIWSSIGYNMVLFLAGMQTIPRQFYEAAEIDGAGRIRQFFQITLPLLSPTIFFVTVISVINALQAFDLIYVMIGKNNPALADSETIVYLFYEKGFIQSNGGYAAAIAFLLLGIIIVFTAGQFWLQRRWVHYD
jgi:multiple sugar transport system permease protein